MRFHFGSRCACFAVGLVVLFASGCGGAPKMVKVEGKLMKGPQPFTPTAGESVRISFSGKGPKGEDADYGAEVSATDGSFVVNAAGGGVPVGRYKVTVSSSMTGSDPASLAKMGTINKQFAGITGKEYEVTDNPHNISIDIISGTFTVVK
jgi:hypothetical protein